MGLMGSRAGGQSPQRSAPDIALPPQSSDMPLDELLALYGYETSDPISEHESEGSDAAAHLPDMTLDKVRGGFGTGQEGPGQVRVWSGSVGCPPRICVAKGRALGGRDTGSRAGLGGVRGEGF